MEGWPDMYLKHISERTNNRNQGIQPFLDLMSSQTIGSKSNIFESGGYGNLQQTFPGSKEVQKIGWEGFSTSP